MLNILSIFLAFLENMNFNSLTSNDFLKTLPKDIRSESCLRKEMKAIDHIVSLHSYEIQVDYMDTSNQRRYSSIADCCTRPNIKMANFSSNSPVFCCLKTLSKIQEVTTFSSFVKQRTQSWQTAPPGRISRWLILLQVI